MPNHRELRVLERARSLSIYVFRVSVAMGTEPGARHYQMQLRTAVGSIPANIAEGCDQETAAQFARYVSIAIGSAGEALNHVAEIRAVGLLTQEAASHIEEELEHIRAMLICLRRHLRNQ